MKNGDLEEADDNRTDSAGASFGESEMNMSILRFGRGDAEEINS